MKYAIAIAALIVSVSAANAKDVLVAVMHGKDGKPEIHYQAIQENCALLMTKWRERAQQRLPVMLTFEAPPKFTGKVLEAFCVFSDGSIGERFRAHDFQPI